MKSRIRDEAVKLLTTRLLHFFQTDMYIFTASLEKPWKLENHRKDLNEDPPWVFFFFTLNTKMLWTVYKKFSDQLASAALCSRCCFIFFTPLLCLTSPAAPMLIILKDLEQSLPFARFWSGSFITCSWYFPLKSHLWKQHFPGIK